MKNMNGKWIKSNTRGIAYHNKTGNFNNGPEDNCLTGSLNTQKDFFETHAN